MDKDTLQQRFQERTRGSDILLTEKARRDFEKAVKIFIVGPPRSGTTLVNSIVAGKFFLPECTFVSNLMQSMNNTLKFSDNERFAFYAHNLKNLAEVYKHSIFDFLVTASIKVGAVREKKFIYKDPMLTNYLNYFPLFFGENYRVIFCLRDPRDTVASMFNVFKRQDPQACDDKLFDQAVKFIYPFFHNFHDFVNDKLVVDRRKITFVKFESILMDKTSINELESFCGFSFEPESHKQDITDRLDTDSPFYSENYGGEFSAKPVGQYKKVLSKKQIEDIEKVFSFYLSHLGYQNNERQVLNSEV